MSDAICGGVISWSKWWKLAKKGEAPLMSLIRKRVRYTGRYRYRIIDPLSDKWWWEDERDKHG
jgi:hypothetical protein